MGHHLTTNGSILHKCVTSLDTYVPDSHVSKCTRETWPRARGGWVAG